MHLEPFAIVHDLGKDGRARPAHEALPKEISMQLRRLPDGSVSCRATANQTVVVDRIGFRLAEMQGSRIVADGYHSWDFVAARDLREAGRGFWGAVIGEPQRQSCLSIRLTRPPDLGVMAMSWDGHGQLSVFSCGTPSQHSSFLSERTGNLHSLNHKQLEPGESVASDPILLSEHLQLSGGMIMPPAGKRRVREAWWMSWNVYARSITPARLLAAAPMVAEGGGLLLDDGPFVWGDWNEFHPRFGSNLETLASKVVGTGHKFGLWIAPFLVATNSVFAKTNRDLLLRNHSGTLVRDSRAPGAPYILDTSKAGARQHLAQLGERYARCGVSALKIDFLYAGATPGARSEGLSDIQAYRAGVSALTEPFRRVVGDNANVFACGAMPQPLLGLVDSCRSGDDAVLSPPFGGDTPLLIRTTDRARAQLRNLALRNLLWGAAVPADPDAVSFGRIGFELDDLSRRDVTILTQLAEHSAGPLMFADKPNVRVKQILQTLQHKCAGKEGVATIPQSPFSWPTAPADIDVFGNTAGAPYSFRWQGPSIDPNLE